MPFDFKDISAIVLASPAVQRAFEPLRAEPSLQLLGLLKVGSMPRAADFKLFQPLLASELAQKLCSLDPSFASGAGGNLAIYERGGTAWIAAAVAPGLALILCGNDSAVLLQSFAQVARIKAAIAASLEESPEAAGLWAETLIKPISPEDMKAWFG